jgi:hypothetical protein
LSDGPVSRFVLIGLRPHRLYAAVLTHELPCWIHNTLAHRPRSLSDYPCDDAHVGIAALDERRNA